MTFPLLTGGALNSILFGVYGNELRRLQNICRTDAERKNEWAQNVFLAGSTAGLIHSLVACPIELVKIRLQTQNRELLLFFVSQQCVYEMHLHDFRSIDWMHVLIFFGIKMFVCLLSFVLGSIFLQRNANV